MKIQLTEKIFIVVSEYSYDVCIHTPRKNDPNYLKPFAYCTSLENALKRVAQIKLADMDETVDIDGFLAAYRDVHDLIRGKIPEELKTP